MSFGGFPLVCYFFVLGSFHFFFHGGLLAFLVWSRHFFLGFSLFSDVFSFFWELFGELGLFGGVLWQIQHFWWFLLNLVLMHIWPRVKTKHVPRYLLWG